MKNEIVEVDREWYDREKLGSYLKISPIEIFS